ncbi:hypothetical protein AC578_8316 [Pseudocercospora eumusae]|uniref:Oxysterol-binding protein n=1 Tax=Pseudocercospora eumusae TaxID=321146 RepID=A0A139H2X0_9PEZI|nr:hypothetical protein AC578_8316 [Pseudocercospora eumusae]
MVLGHRKNSLTSGSRSSMEAHSDAEDGDETVVSSEQGNVLTHIISQLRPGADLSRVTLPTFILEPRSMLERITNFMAHPETLLPPPTIDDPVQRFVAVTKFYMSGWHIKPPGVKKPLNPILGEIFTGYWDYPDGTRGYYISEQTSHHPPKSSYFFMAPEHHIRIDGTLKPRSKFLGNSVGSFMEGIAVLRFLNRNERYFVTQPNIYARGILFGKMKYELGDHAVVRCPETGLEADIEFKVKGWVGGTYNAIGGFIKDSKSGKNLYELTGLWNAQMYIKDLSTGQKELLFDASHAKPSVPKSRPLEEQAPRESQKLWHTTTAAIKKADQKTATDEKSRIEDEQRKEAAERGDQEWKPKLFRAAPPGDEQSLDWVIDAEVDHTASIEKQIEQILAIAPILPGQTSQSSKQQPVPQHQMPQNLPMEDPAPQNQAQQQQGAGGDLIDFEQNEEAAHKTQSAPQVQEPEEMASLSLQQPLVPTQTSQTTPAAVGRRGVYGDPIRRMDSTGAEDVFHDAES